MLSVQMLWYPLWHCVAWVLWNEGKHWLTPAIFVSVLAYHHLWACPYLYSTLLWYPRNQNIGIKFLFLPQWPALNLDFHCRFYGFHVRYQWFQFVVTHNLTFLFFPFFGLFATFGIYFSASKRWRKQSDKADAEKYARQRERKIFAAMLSPPTA